jgi:soluble lytic murein transglycosylase-like protein
VFLVRFLFRLFRRLAWWQQLGAVAVTPVLALNLAVAFVGASAIFPLSPFYLPQKWAALKAYGAHRPGCLFSGHDNLAAITDRAERDAGLPRGLMRAVVEVESDSRPHRISWAGAMGPAQLMPGTAAMLKVRDPFDPDESIAAGARYLASCLRRTGGDVKLAVASYNAGPGAVNGAVPQNGQTELYVARVMQRFNARD